MKRMLFTVAVLAAFSGIADEVSSCNVLGLLPVSSSAKRTIVSVPWCAMSSTDDAAIQVSNLVKTANLTVNDMLHYVNSDGSYLSWRLAEGDAGVKYWASVQQASEGGFELSPNSHDQTVARGNSIVLIRQSATNDNGTAKIFYLYGQVGTKSELASVITAGSSDAPAYSLVASPKTAAWQVNGDDHTWSDVGAKDNLIVYNANGKMIPLYWDGTQWGASNDVYTVLGGEDVRSGSKFEEYTADIPAGTGVWYVSNGGAPSLTWSDVPTK